MSQDKPTANPMHQFAHFLDGLSDAIAEAKSIRRQFGSSISSEIESMLNEMEWRPKQSETCLPQRIRSCTSREPCD